MTRFTLAIIAFAYASSGCKRVDESRIADKAACAAMARSIEVNSRFLDTVTQLLANADRAVTRADLWNQKKITDAQDGSGLFSGAAGRAGKHAGAALSFCEAVRQVHAGIESIAHTIREPSIHMDERTLNLPCFDPYMVDAPSAGERAKVASAWEAQRTEVQTAESRYRDACKAKFGVDNVSVGGFGLGGTGEPPIK